MVECTPRAILVRQRLLTLERAKPNDPNNFCRFFGFYTPVA
ncbi:hypothetical protein D082_17840 [Synechocystis sp. PCC 6714]|nr:hypothetical protein D082_17840 [Synechocystis sp. PCC 6714]